MIITKHLFLNIQASMYHGTDMWDSRYHFVFCTWHFASIAVDGSWIILQKIKQNSLTAQSEHYTSGQKI